MLNCIRSIYKPKKKNNEIIQHPPTPATLHDFCSSKNTMDKYVHLEKKFRSAPESDLTHEHKPMSLHDFPSSKSKDRYVQMEIKLRQARDSGLRDK